MPIHTPTDSAHAVGRGPGGPPHSAAAMTVAARSNTKTTGFRSPVKLSPRITTLSDAAPQRNASSQPEFFVHSRSTTAPIDAQAAIVAAAATMLVRGAERDTEADNIKGTYAQNCYIYLKWQRRRKPC